MLLFLYLVTVLLPVHEKQLGAEKVGRVDVMDLQITSMQLSEITKCDHAETERT